MSRLEERIKRLSTFQQILLYKILELNSKSFYSSEVTEGYSGGGVLAGLVMNGIVERVSGGRKPLFKVNNYESIIKVNIKNQLKMVKEYIDEKVEK